MLYLPPTQKRGKNDNQRQVVSGWRFIHHPKVKKKTGVIKEIHPQASGSVRVLLEMPSKETRWTSVSAKTLLGA